VIFKRMQDQHAIKPAGDLYTVLMRMGGHPTRIHMRECAQLRYGSRKILDVSTAFAWLMHE